ncbi:BofC C-terminal domain-containing protein [Thermosediminibacter litoriperuensis]|uniref:BofC-like protein n=1 Tax=Thermosediminibacter litoriperuensis TaxID=291989 RepID=A0A5S5AF81_9FIRM|nr:BofC C-terminal domain-containing protein [Thermosediminibacter litoriperuensis]TYP48700.1 BofC-like protein [Thermosediminibacter litoriperuensis]
MPKKVLLYSLLILFFLVISFGYGFFLSFLDFNKTQDMERISGNTEALQLPEEKLNPGAKIVFVTRYRGCGHELQKENSADDKFLGYTKTQLQEEFKEWKVESFSSSQVILKREVDGICENHYYIGLYDGYVALFQGEPGKNSKVLEKTDIPAEILKEEDRRLLENGIIINSRDEFLKIREGLTH